MASDVYSGNCHCGAYRFELRLAYAEPLATQECDCSLCRKLGAWWFPSGGDRERVMRDEGHLVEYIAESTKIQFCDICGTVVYSDHGSGPLAGIRQLNGRVMHASKYFKPPLKEDSSADEVSPLPRRGSCHCGLVQVELLGDIDGLEIKEDDCSICMRNAWIGIYPPTSQVKVTGADNMQNYSFGRKFMGHPFCKTCGVHAVMDVYGPPQLVVDRLPEEKKAMVKKNLDMKPVNVRVLDDIALGRLKVNRKSEGASGYAKDVLGVEDENELIHRVE